MEIKDIKSPEDVLEFMKENIKYGWVDANGEYHEGNIKNARELYRTMSLETVLKNNAGTCIEQAYLIHHLLDQINVKNKLFCIRIFSPNPEKENDFLVFTHCFVLYYQGEKIYHLEFPDRARIGIYDYDNEEEVIFFLQGYYKKLYKGVSVRINQFSELPEGYNAFEINAYMEKQGDYDNGKYTW